MDSGASVNVIEGQEARNILLQFAAQNVIGAQKDLMNQIIEPSRNLQHSFMDVQTITNIANTIPGVLNEVRRETSSPQPSIPVQISAAPPGISITDNPRHQEQVQAIQTKPKVDDGQMELNFTYDIAKDIVDRLDRVEFLLKKFLESQEDSKKNLPSKKLN